MHACMHGLKKFPVRDQVAIYHAIMQTPHAVHACNSYALHRGGYRISQRGVTKK